MKFEAYNDGKVLLTGDFPQLKVHNMYVGTADGEHFETDKRVTITIGVENYWNGIIKLSKEEANGLIKGLKKMVLDVGKDDATFYKVETDENKT